MNVLFVISDDLNDWVLHPPEHPQVKTPNIDRLRERSVTFTNAHANVPVCSPSRKCLFSGLYPWTTHEYDFCDWEKSPGLQHCTPLPLHFRNHGYAVFGTGKLLHEGRGGDFYTEYGIDVDYGPWPWRGDGRVRFTPHPYQYDKWLPHLPEKMHRDLNYAPLSQIPDWPGSQGWFYESEQPFHYTSDTDRDPMPDEQSVTWALEVMQRSHDKPFFLGVGLMRPHTPLYVPDEYFARFPIEEVTLPPYLEGDLSDCAPTLRNRWDWGFRKFEGLLAAGGEQAWREWVQAYLACVAFVDDQIGRLLDGLKAAGHHDDTAVVLTGDNGYHVGEKDCIQKWHLWDESTRVPLIVHVPGTSGTGRECEHPVSHVDIYPTLVDLCGLPEQPHGDGGGHGLEGHSLRPLLEAPEIQQWHGLPVAVSAVKEKDEEQPHISVRSQRYRYTRCNNGEEELYDHQIDPHEWHNLINDASYEQVKAMLRNELEKAGAKGEEKK